MNYKRKPNRLITEKSPYLLQHAYNPVNWFSWNEEAFEKASQENKPIFLSIGYSTCHWCHVMARESFEDEEVAAFLNEHYVSIKVDREERPDVDSVYMKVCQMMTGQGGWPLTVIMTPDQIPFYAGTYFPKESKYGMPGLMEVITQLYRKYTTDPDHISEVTESVTNALEKTVQEKSAHRLTKQTTDDAFKQLTRNFDSNHGGFGLAPKFPQPQNIMYLLKYYYFTGEQTALDIVEKSLHAMANGGIFDQIGFGFARYSTDEKWLVPHFEKMLYDNALLLIAYTECYQVTNNPFYKQISEQIIEFISREMTNSEGAFYSAIDADSEGIEGKYYVWDFGEIFATLGDELGEMFTTVYGMTPDGNFEGKNIPNRIHNPPSDIEMENPDNERRRLLEKAQKQLLAAREKRVYPHVDDKTLTSWNAMMIAGLAKAGAVFKEELYINMAEKAVRFIEESLFDKGRLMARFRDGETKHKGYLDDYAFLIWAYLEMYQATFSLGFLNKGKTLMNDMLDLFWDEEHGGFYLSGSDSEQLIAQDKEVYDGALPSGNSVASVMLTRLAYLTGETDYLDKVETMYFSFYEDINRQASAAAFFMQSLLLTENKTREIVIIGAKDDPDHTKLLDSLQSEFLPGTVILVGESAMDFKNIAPFATEYEQLEQKTTVYICENFACQQPTTDIEEVMRRIKGQTPSD
ncbi:thioredoxin domain-containing protein [Virgibacillus sp. MSJ-26]|uniref:thioredoxin domain-containing protein n=1 Tax=Virgibacillus sp. MSJ-26 TaxID=2841522 RepID=UPI001C0F4C99|nr:thioredoxin domain-containing protein [Virgibacillus sp. MSJ-26]MBU5467845.1 thioredoxin domain-containing protein [Virgibacillus sp. MSJ-26]